MRNKIVTAGEAVNIVRDRDTLVCSGFGTNGVREELCVTRLLKLGPALQ
ncbi:MAG TPA: hypothetical protein VFR86_24920 [Burkholderiaceae bacterium]|nr:hypothetical protein [Burkholderiaceae bacterium]